MPSRKKSASEHGGSTRPLIGLIPAAGHAARWRGQLGYSKELYPVPDPRRVESGPRPVIAWLLDSFQTAGIERAVIVTRAAKLDIAAKLRDGQEYGCRLAYVIVDESPSVPYSVSAAIPFVEEFDVVLGFPDIVFRPSDAIRTLVAARTAADWDVLLGLFESDRPEAVDMVDFDDSGAVRRIVVKQPACGLRYSWILALWSPRFTAYLRSSPRAVDDIGQSQRELHLGHIMQHAIDAGLKVVGVPIAGGRFLDLGSPEEVRRLAAVVAGS
jgi:glucose-1-phosphate thymidylyltransferase